METSSSPFSSEEERARLGGRSSSGSEVGVVHIASECAEVTSHSRLSSSPSSSSVMHRCISVTHLASASAVEDRDYIMRYKCAFVQLVREQIQRFDASWEEWNAPEAGAPPGRSYGENPQPYWNSRRGHPSSGIQDYRYYVNRNSQEYNHHPSSNYSCLPEMENGSRQVTHCCPHSCEACCSKRQMQFHNNCFISQYNENGISYPGAINVLTYPHVHKKPSMCTCGIPQLNQCTCEMSHFVNEKEHIIPNGNVSTTCWNGHQMNLSHYLTNEEHHFQNWNDLPRLLNEHEHKEIHVSVEKQDTIGNTLQSQMENTYEANIPSQIENYLEWRNDTFSNTENIFQNKSLTEEKLDLNSKVEPMNDKNKNAIINKFTNSETCQNINTPNIDVKCGNSQSNELSHDASINYFPIQQAGSCLIHQQFQEIHRCPYSENNFSNSNQTPDNINCFTNTNHKLKDRKRETSNNYETSQLFTKDTENKKIKLNNSLPAEIEINEHPLSACETIKEKKLQKRVKEEEHTYSRLITPYESRHKSRNLSSPKQINLGQCPEQQLPFLDSHKIQHSGNTENTSMSDKNTLSEVTHYNKNALKSEKKELQMKVTTKQIHFQTQDKKILLKDQYNEKNEKHLQRSVKRISRKKNSEKDPIRGYQVISQEGEKHENKQINENKLIYLEDETLLHMESQSPNFENQVHGGEQGLLWENRSPTPEEKSVCSSARSPSNHSNDKHRITPREVGEKKQTCKYNQTRKCKKIDLKNKKLTPTENKKLLDYTSCKNILDSEQDITHLQGKMKENASMMLKIINQDDVQGTVKEQNDMENIPNIQVTIKQDMQNKLQKHGSQTPNVISNKEINKLDINNEFEEIKLKCTMNENIPKNILHSETDTNIYVVCLRGDENRVSKNIYQKDCFERQINLTSMETEAISTKYEEQFPIGESHNVPSICNTQSWKEEIEAKPQTINQEQKHIQKVKLKIDKKQYEDSILINNDKSIQVLQITKELQIKKDISEESLMKIRLPAEIKITINSQLSEIQKYSNTIQENGTTLSFKLPSELTVEPKSMETNKKDNLQNLPPCSSKIGHQSGDTLSLIPDKDSKLDETLLAQNKKCIKVTSEFSQPIEKTLLRRRTPYSIVYRIPPSSSKSENHHTLLKRISKTPRSSKEASKAFSSNETDFVGPHSVNDIALPDKEEKVNNFLNTNENKKIKFEGEIEKNIIIKNKSINPDHQNKNRKTNSQELECHKNFKFFSTLKQDFHADKQFLLSSQNESLAIHDNEPDISEMHDKKSVNRDNPPNYLLSSTEHHNPTMKSREVNTMQNSMVHDQKIQNANNEFESQKEIIFGTSISLSSQESSFNDKAEIKNLKYSKRQKKSCLLDNQDTNSQKAIKKRISINQFHQNSLKRERLFKGVLACKKVKCQQKTTSQTNFKLLKKMVQEEFPSKISGIPNQLTKSGLKIFRELFMKENYNVVQQHKIRLSYTRKCVSDITNQPHHNNSTKCFLNLTKQKPTFKVTHGKNVNDIFFNSKVKQNSITDAKKIDNDEDKEKMQKIISFKGKNFYAEEVNYQDKENNFESINSTENEKKVLEDTVGLITTFPIDPHEKVISYEVDRPQKENISMKLSNKSSKEMFQDDQLKILQKHSLSKTNLPENVGVTEVTPPKHSPEENNSIPLREILAEKKVDHSVREQQAVPDKNITKEIPITIGQAKMINTAGRETYSSLQKSHSNEEKDMKVVNKINSTLTNQEIHFIKYPSRSNIQFIEQTTECSTSSEEIHVKEEKLNISKDKGEILSQREEKKLKRLDLNLGLLFETNVTCNFTTTQISSSLSSPQLTSSDNSPPTDFTQEDSFSPTEIKSSTLSIDNTEENNSFTEFHRSKSEVKLSPGHLSDLEYETTITKQFRNVPSVASEDTSNEHINAYSIMRHTLVCLARTILDEKETQLTNSLGNGHHLGKYTSLDDIPQTKVAALKQITRQLFTGELQPEEVMLYHKSVKARELEKFLDEQNQESVKKTGSSNENSDSIQEKIIKDQYIPPKSVKHSSLKTSAQDTIKTLKEIIVNLLRKEQTLEQIKKSEQNDLCDKNSMPKTKQTLLRIARIVLYDDISHNTNETLQETNKNEDYSKFEDIPSCKILKLKQIAKELLLQELISEKCTSEHKNIHSVKSNDSSTTQGENESSIFPNIKTKFPGKKTFFKSVKQPKNEISINVLSHENSKNSLPINSKSFKTKIKQIANIFFSNFTTDAQDKFLPEPLLECEKSKAINLSNNSNTELIEKVINDSAFSGANLLHEKENKQKCVPPFLYNTFHPTMRNYHEPKNDSYYKEYVVAHMPSISPSPLSKCLTSVELTNAQEQTLLHGGVNIATSGEPPCSSHLSEYLPDEEEEKFQVEKSDEASTSHTYPIIPQLHTHTQNNASQLLYTGTKSEILSSPSNSELLCLERNPPSIRRTKLFSSLNECPLYIFPETYPFHRTNIINNEEHKNKRYCIYQNPYSLSMTKHTQYVFYQNTYPLSMTYHSQHSKLNTKGFRFDKDRLMGNESRISCPSPRTDSNRANNFAEQLNIHENIDNISKKNYKQMHISGHKLEQEAEYLNESRASEPSLETMNKINVDTRIRTPTNQQNYCVGFIPYKSQSVISHEHSQLLEPVQHIKAPIHFPLGQIIPTFNVTSEKKADKKQEKTQERFKRNKWKEDDIIEKDNREQEEIREKKKQDEKIQDKRRQEEDKLKKEEKKRWDTDMRIETEKNDEGISKEERRIDEKGSREEERPKELAKMQVKDRNQDREEKFVHERGKKHMDESEKKKGDWRNVDKKRENKGKQTLKTVEENEEWKGKEKIYNKENIKQEAIETESIPALVKIFVDQMFSDASPSEKQLISRFVEKFIIKVFTNRMRKTCEKISLYMLMESFIAKIPDKCDIVPMTLLVDNFMEEVFENEKRLPSERLSSTALLHKFNLKLQAESKTKYFLTEDFVQEVSKTIKMGPEEKLRIASLVDGFIDKLSTSSIKENPEELYMSSMIEEFTNKISENVHIKPQEKKIVYFQVETLVDQVLSNDKKNDSRKLLELCPSDDSQDELVVQIRERGEKETHACIKGLPRLDVAADNILLRVKVLLPSTSSQDDTSKEEEKEGKKRKEKKITSEKESLNKRDCEDDQVRITLEKKREAVDAGVSIKVKLSEHSVSSTSESSTNKIPKHKEIKSTAHIIEKFVNEISDKIDIVPAERKRMSSLLEKFVEKAHASPKRHSSLRNNIIKKLKEDGICKKIEQTKDREKGKRTQLINENTHLKNLIDKSITHAFDEINSHRTSSLSNPQPSETRKSENGTSPHSSVDKAHSTITQHSPKSSTYTDGSLSRNRKIRIVASLQPRSLWKLLWILMVLFLLLMMYLGAILGLSTCHLRYCSHEWPHFLRPFLLPQFQTYGSSMNLRGVF